MKASSVWSVPPQNLFLAEDEVHVWCGALDLSESLIEKFMNSLSEDEQSRANRFYFLRDKNRFIVARGMLRKILSFYLGGKPNTIQFQYSPYGKPSLHPYFNEHISPPKSSEIKFNISHSNAIALFGITKSRQIGIDVEYTKPLPDTDKVAERFFGFQENLKYQQLPKEQKLTGFYHCWTRKEAFIKAIGEGLSYPLDQFEVSFLPNEKPRIKHIQNDKVQGEAWSLKVLEPYPEYIGAVAVEGKSLRFIQYEFQTGITNNLERRKG